MDSLLLEYINETFGIQLPDDLQIKHLLLERQRVIGTYSIRERIFKEKLDAKVFWHPDLIKNLKDSIEENFVLHMINSHERTFIIFTDTNTTKSFGYISNTEPIKK
jgi:hypothetical protein